MTWMLAIYAVGCFAWAFAAKSFKVLALGYVLVGLAIATPLITKPAEPAPSEPLACEYEEFAK